MSTPENVWYLVPRAVYAPAALSLVSIAVALSSSRTALVALPFIWLGAFFVAPNLNLVNGCLPHLAMFAGFITSGFHEAIGVAILAGTAAGYYGGAIEKHLRKRPYHGEDDPTRNC